ncbi:class I SAM-dependent methyltransferase [Anthocerotibacter panamensis]|uniref:class I SAM-dependent methyltransferase n=1 Tax=Anthocerotibacter panamensis TaxID=2857077 RepID=UPI001C40581C|nr:class I SAM-dependent methyltransferase [Anthocerotibacter panamensis]
MLTSGLSLPTPNLKRLPLKVNARAEAALRQGHPWVYDQSLTEAAAGQPGDLGVVFDRRGRFLAIGLWDPTSPIRLRVLQALRPAPIDQDWFRKRLLTAQALRLPLATADTTGYRLVNGENDSLPGLVLDRYGTTLVLKLYTCAWLPHLELLLSLIAEVFAPGGLVLRLSRNIQALCAPYGLKDGQVLWGEPETPVLFREYGLVFEADVLRGQKTGFFLDQRENRKFLGSLVEGRKVLNVFSFSGGFSVWAARGGCSAVTSLDLSEHALASAQRNFAHNPDCAETPHHLLQGDAFRLLKELADQDQRFGCVILDPPSFAPRERDRPAALKAYRYLLDLGLAVLDSGGLLVAASCSAHIHRSEFLELIGTALEGREYRTLAYTGPALDHPVRFTEAEYLKCWFGYID